MPITPDLLRLGFHHMYLEYRGADGHRYRMRICEHLLALRLTGWDNVRIIMHTHALPYDGSGLQFWHAVEPHLRPDGKLRPYTPPSGISSKRRPLWGDKFRYVVYHRGRGVELDELEIQIEIEYPGLPRRMPYFSFPRDFEKVVGARHRGRRRLYRVAKIARMLGWQHFDKILWEHETDPGELLEEEAAHRAFDAGGDFEVLTPAGQFFVGRLVSVCGGHEDDNSLIKKIHGGPQKFEDTS